MCFSATSNRIANLVIHLSINLSCCGVGQRHKNSIRKCWHCFCLCFDSFIFVHQKLSVFIAVDVCARVLCGRMVLIEDKCAIIRN